MSKTFQSVAPDTWVDAFIADDDGIFLAYDSASDRTSWFARAAALLDLGEGMPQREAVLACLHPGDRARIEARWDAVLSRVGPFQMRYRFRKPDGSVLHVVERGETVSPRDPETGRGQRYRGVLEDVTDRHRLAEELTRSRALLEALFRDAPIGLGTWDTEFRFMRVNHALAEVNGLPAEAHVGKRPDELLPGLTDFDALYTRWQEVLETGAPWRDVAISGETPAQPGRVRHWREDFFPLRDGDKVIGLAAVVQEVTARKQAEASRKTSDARYRSLFEHIDEGFCVVEVQDTTDAGGRIDYRVVEANEAFHHHTGFPGEAVNRWLREAAPDIEEHWFEIYGRVARTGEQARFTEHSAALERWFDVCAFRIDDSEGARVAVLFRDITKLKKQEEVQRLLLHEVNHRAKNLLGLVQSIAQQTAATSGEDFTERFGARLRAMAEAQDVMVRSDWKTVPLEDLLRSQLGHFDHLIDARITLAGPDVSVTPGAAQTLAMATHELATNAAKYGALSNDEGRVAIDWSLGTDEASRAPRFGMSWIENGGPPVADLGRGGFGTTVTTRMAKAATGGDVALDYTRAGLAWTLTCPAGAVLADAPLAARDPRSVSNPRSGPDWQARATILVVEDDPLIAFDAGATLERMGYAVLGPAADADQALDLLTAHGCDLALLDINLGAGRTSAPVAEALSAQAVPFVVVTAYDSHQVPPAFRGARILGKPLDPAQLGREIGRFVL